ncbi:MAG: hypothetical protein WD598_09510 [Acidimicrobiia bacterium]
MGFGRALGRLATLGAAIGGIVFFWRKRQEKKGTATSPTASDTP